MEIWCDSADAQIVASFAKQGWLMGVTTNPKILSSQKILASKQIRSLLDTQQGLVAVQVSAISTEGMLAQAKKLRALNTRIIVKIPMTSMGIKALPLLREQGISTLATAVFSAEQFLLAAKMKVDYIAPYLNQMEQQGIKAIQELATMQEIKKNYGFSTKIMAASIQDIQVIKRIARLGIDAVTLTPACLSSWMENNHSITSTNNLNQAWLSFAKEHAGELFALTEDLE